MLTFFMVGLLELDRRASETSSVICSQHWRISVLYAASDKPKLHFYRVDTRHAVKTAALGSGPAHCVIEWSLRELEKVSQLFIVYNYESTLFCLKWRWQTPFSVGIHLTVRINPFHTVQPDSFSKVKALAQMDLGRGHFLKSVSIDLI